MVSNSRTGRELTASTWPSSSSRTWRELGSTSIAVERVARVGHVLLVLLVPGVEGAEVEDHQPGQVRVRRAEARPRPHLARRAQVDHLALGAVHGERNRRVEHPQRGHVGQGSPDVVARTGCGLAGRHQVAAHILHRHRV